MSPLTMLAGNPFPVYDTLLLKFRTYVQIYEDNDPTNTTRTRTTRAIISLNPTEIVQGGYMFMSLVTKFPIERKQCDVPIMPTHAIQAVEAMVKRQDQPLMRDGRLNFEWRPDVTFGDGYEVDEYTELDLDDEESIED